MELGIGIIPLSVIENLLTAARHLSKFLFNYFNCGESEREFVDVFIYQNFKCEGYRILSFIFILPPQH